MLVTTDPGGGPLSDKEYVYVDWGADFVLQHSMSMPSVTPNLFVNLGPLGLSYVLSAGGAGYFRMRAVRPHLSAKRLHLVPGMSRFSYPIYVVYSATVDEAILDPALAGLRSVSKTAIE